MGVAATLFGAQHLKGIEQRRPGAAQWLPGPRSIGQKEFPKKIFHFGFSISDNKSLLLLLLLLLLLKVFIVVIIFAIIRIQFCAIVILA